MHSEPGMARILPSGRRELAWKPRDLSEYMMRPEAWRPQGRGAMRYRPGMRFEQLDSASHYYGARQDRAADKNISRAGFTRIASPESGGGSRNELRYAGGCTLGRQCGAKAAGRYEIPQRGPCASSKSPASE